MFLYLSFLRPPPVQIDLRNPQRCISITPQLSNDLRTEFPEMTLDLFYIWLPSGFAQPSRPSFKKLTTYHGSSSMYKEVQIPLPPQVKDGQNWTLALSTSMSQEDLRIPLHALADFSRPLPLYSMPIAVSSKGSVGTAKQERIRRIYSFPFDSDAISFALAEHTSFDLDKKIWDSGLGLSSWLINNFTNDHDSQGLVARLNSCLTSTKITNVLELGAGTGIVSIVLAALRSKLQLASEDTERHDCIFTTDLPSAMPLLEENIQRNMSIMGSLDSPATAIPRAAVLDWGEDLPDSINAKDLDLVIMADVTYNTASFPALIKTLSSLTQRKDPQAPDPLFLLGYKERDEEERTLWRMAESIGITFSQVDNVLGAGEKSVEVWIGEYKKPG